jgi:fucose permease
MIKKEQMNKTDTKQNTNTARLFLGSNFALIATSVTFAIIGAIMGPLKEVFALTNAEVGWIGGAALWGFSITIFIFGPLCDALGMKLLFRLSFIGHILGVLTLIFAEGFAMLFVGALILAMANGLVEAAANPLVATLYPNNKTEMLNKFHVWFPGGIVIGGLISFGLDSVGIFNYQIKLLVILLPTIIYGILFLGQKFPATERLQSGISSSEMIKSTLFRPLFWVIIISMMMTASIELGPNRWIPAVLESAGISGILVLVWINLLMAIMRFKAGPVVHKFSPTGILLISAAISGLGLYWLSFTDSLGSAILAGTVFAIGVSYFWPTILGLTSERIPKGGAFALSLVGGVGTIIVGLVTAPVMGGTADNYLHEKLPLKECTVVLEKIVNTFPELKAEQSNKTSIDYDNAIISAQEVLDSIHTYNSLPKLKTANALRSAIAVAPNAEVTAEVKDILGPAENYGGKISFRKVAPLSLILIIIFGILYYKDKKQGGYKAEIISDNTD